MLVVLAAGAVLLSSCAYYNTFYLAQKYYERGTAGLPYPVEKPTGQASNEFRRSIDYSKKVLSQYPKSKWVDDAYLLWARALLGRDDPLQTVNMLEDFNARFPGSPLRNEAEFYLGVGYRNARRYEQALAALDTFLVRAPKSDLVPYAQLERARTLKSLDRPAAAARAASVIIAKYAKSGLLHQAYTERAEALLANGDYGDAQADFRTLGERSRTDAERLDYLLREADCLEAARDYDNELALLEDALRYEIEPVRPDSGSVRTPQQQTAGLDRFGRLLMRIGTVHLLAGRLDKAIESYRRIVEDYPKTPLGAEAQYRIGYAYETLGDDFDQARVEYDKVKDQTGATGFGIQALQRSQNLARLEQFRAAAGDSSGKAADAGFVLAEQYLFQLDKPERALAEYRKIARQYPDTPAGAKALLAEGWVLARKLDRRAAADSLFWLVVREHPATEAQLAARDYLEAEGHQVPADLIQLPEPVAPEPEPEVQAPAAVDTVLGPGGEPRLGPLAPGETMADSLRRRAGLPPLPHGAPPDSMPGRPRPAFLGGAAQDSAAVFMQPAPGPPPPAPGVSDSTAPARPTAPDTTSSPSTATAPRDTTAGTPAPAPQPAPGDTTAQTPAPADTSTTAPADTSGTSGFVPGHEPDGDGAMMERAARPRLWSFRILGVTLQSASFVRTPRELALEAERERRARAIAARDGRGRVFAYPR